MRTYGEDAEAAFVITHNPPRRRCPAASSDYPHSKSQGVRRGGTPSAVPVARGPRGPGRMRGPGRGAAR